jgi:hypothetical protein
VVRRLLDIRMMPIAMAALGAGVLGTLFLADSLLQGALATVFAFTLIMAIAIVRLPDWKDAPEKKAPATVLGIFIVLAFVAIGLAVRFLTW